MRIRLDAIVTTAVLLGAAIAAPRAAGPLFWQVATRADFLRGEVDNLSVDNEGRLSLGPSTETVFDASSPFLWTLLPGASGSVLAGSGNDGKVFRLGADGRATTFYDAPEMEVHALAAAPQGGVYVATSPDGRIYRVDAAGTAVPFFDPGDKYIWSLATDAAGNVYAGTGEKGVIYRVTPDGKGSAFYVTKASNVVALAFNRSGDLIACTENPGRVFRIDRGGKASVLLDSELREIRGVRIAPDGTIYVAAVGLTAPEERPPDAPTAATPRSAPVATVTTEISAVAVAEPASQPAAEARTGTDRVSPGTAKGAVYRIREDGLWDTVWESADVVPYDLSLETDGGVLVGTGPKGQLFRIAGEPPRATLVGKVAAGQVTRFLAGAQGALFVATANPGKVVRLGPGRAARGSYESEVRDAQTASTWGTISWKASVPAGARLELFTRSGNSATPDDTWSPWGGPYANADGSQIQSPKARYLQWRAVLTGGDATPVVTSVTAAYLPRNLRPAVSSITVHPPGTVFQKPYSTGDLEIAGYDNPGGETRPSITSGGAATAPVVTQAAALGRRIYQKGLQTFQWKAEDGNEDRLEFDILYRRESDTTWRTLRRGLTDSLFVWDTTSVPNGTYVIRVVASDAVANPPGVELTGDLDSTTFDIDNTPPAIQITGTRQDGARTLITFQVRDDQSVIQRVDYSVGAERWRALYPLDGICDSRQEQFELVLEGEAARGSVVIRAVDAMNNTATARADQDTPPPSGPRRRGAAGPPRRAG